MTSRINITSDAVKTVLQGALGAMTFGAYHQFTTNKMMEMNNQIMEQKHQYQMDILEQKYQYQIDKMHKEDVEMIKELSKKIEALEKRRGWW
jgi:heme A synthase